ncbi:M56 family metallopeptidase [Siminovitchia sp. FSL W7-1587]|uniref:M56 family metallopeptidase n=1 Tax=Siminovitchia sp. FSL W7-1587 TaxID=2954699 RepID=UPI0030CE7C28
MQKLLFSLLEVSIAMSIIALVYMAVTPLLSKIFTAKGRYYTWLVIIIGLIIPFRFHRQESAICIDTFIPAIKTTNSHFVAPYEMTMSSAIPWSVLLSGLWLVGVVVFIIIHVIRHGHFLKMVKRWSMKVEDLQVLNLLHDVQKKLRIKQQVELQICPGISSPMLIGFIRPTILLPTGNIPPDELPLILKHELIHFKRRDIWFRALVFLATALHWFNPFVYLIAREVSIQCEIACDEEVVKNTNVDGRQKYVETIIGVIRKQSKVRSTFSTNFYSGKQGMKHRVFSIMDVRNKKWGFSIFAMIVVATFSTSMMIKISTPDASPEPSVLVPENESDPSMDHEENRKIDQTLPQKDKPVLEVDEDVSRNTTDRNLLIDNDEKMFEYDNPKLIESK